MCKNGPEGKRTDAIFYRDAESHVRIFGPFSTGNPTMIAYSFPETSSSFFSFNRSDDMIITTLNLIGIRLTRLHVETVSGKVPRTRSTSSNRLLLQCQTRLKKKTCASAVFFYKNLINKEMKNKGWREEIQLS